MFDFFHAIAQKSAAVLVASVAAAFGFFAQPNTIVVVPSQPILILPASRELPLCPRSEANQRCEPAPTSTELIQQVSTTTAHTTTTAFANKPATRGEHVESTSTIQVSSSSSSSQIQTKTPEPKPLLTPKTFTAKLILDRTGFSVNQRIDGAYWLLLHTTTTASSGFDWDFSATSIGGTVSILKFDVSFFCDPPPDTPASDSPDQNPVFNVNTSYKCIISLSDSLLRKESKEINFQTGAGRLVIKASNLDTTLKFNKSTNGFVLDNQSAVPITVTGLTFDVSFTALNTSSPIVLRFLEPDNESTLAEYPLQDLPIDSARVHTNASAGMKASFSFTVKPHSQRLLIVQVLGVQPLAIISTNPEVAVTLRQISIDHPDIKTALLSPVISWSCITYDPNRAIQGLPNEQNCR